MRKINQFYKIKDSSGGHPAQLYKINMLNNEYYIVRFSRKKRSDRIKLKHNIDPFSCEDCYVVKNPAIVKYSDLSEKERYKIFRIHQEDFQLIEKIKNKK